LFGYFQLYLYETTGKIIGALWNVPNNIPRVGSTFWDVNHYGALIAALLPIAGAYFLSEKAWKSKIYFFIVSVSMTGALFLTNSRTAWITDGVALIAFATILLYRKIGTKGFAYIITGLLLIIIPLSIAYSHKNGTFRADVKGYFHYRLDSYDSHMLLIQGAFEVFQQYPILGGGYGSFFEHFNKTPTSAVFFGRDPAAFNTRVPAHTIWGELLAESGAVGFTVYLCLFLLITFVLIFVALKSTQSSTVLLSAAMASSYIGLHLAGIFYSYNSEFFWIITILFFTYGYNKLNEIGNYTDVFKHFFKTNKLPTLIIIVLAFTLVFWQLGSTHLIPWDEAIYAKIAKNMVVTNEYIFQTWKQHQPWYEKPPLYMWMSAGFMQILGFAELAPRLPSAIFGFGLVILTYLFAKKLFGTTAAFFASLSLVTTTQFLYYSRTGMVDVTTAFFVTAALIVYYKTTEKNSAWLWLLTGLLIGLGSMVKGVIGLLPLPIILLSDVFIYRRFSFKNYLLLMVSTSAIILPWHIMMYQKYGFAFIKDYIGYHVLDRAIENIEDKGRPIWWYFIVIKVSMRIWFITLLGAFPLALKKVWNKDKNFSFLTLWAIFIFVFFSVAKSKLVWYIIPFYPVAAVLNGYFIAVAINFVTKRLRLEKFVWFKYVFVLLLTLGSLGYLFVNKGLVYTGDLTGSQARLMQAKDRIFGTTRIVYLDRIELPIALYYTDSPFEVVDFLAAKRVPKVSSTDPLILITKKGRYSATVPGHLKPAVTVLEDGDYVLWYLPPEVGTFKLSSVN